MIVEMMHANARITLVEVTEYVIVCHASFNLL